MSWQDIILTTGQVIFVIALFPSIFSNDKPAFSTSLMNAIVLYIMSLTYITLHLYGGAVGLFLTGTCWLILTVQKYLIDHQKAPRKS